MQQLILKNDISESKMKALLHFLKNWDIDAEVKKEVKIAKKKSDFTLSVGIWKDYLIDAKDLRNQAWKRN
jgi:hypothetical protein